MRLKRVLSMRQWSAALRRVGPGLLKGAARKAEWSPKDPTCNYCYTAAEAVWHFQSGPNARPYVIPRDRMRLFGFKDTHWFIKDRSRLLDPTAQQWGKQAVPVELGKPSMFFRGSIMTPRGYPMSERAYRLALAVGIIEEI